MNMTPEKAEELMDNATQGEQPKLTIDEHDGYSAIILEDGINHPFESIVAEGAIEFEFRVAQGKFIAALPEITKLCLSQADELKAKDDELNKLKAHVAVMHSAMSAIEPKFLSGGIILYAREQCRFCDGESMSINEDISHSDSCILQQTPEQSLQAIKDEYYEEAAVLCDDLADNSEQHNHRDTHDVADRIRNLKGKEV